MKTRSMPVGVTMLRLASLFETKTAAAPVMTKAVAHFQVKAADDETRTITGLASTWDLDLGGDVIHKGAFKRTLANLRNSKRSLPLIDQHNYGSVLNVVGKMVDAKETDEGLEATFQIIEGDRGEEIYRRVKGGYIDGLSIGYEAVKITMPTEEERGSGIRRHLTEVKLYEVSVVIWPMNPEARVESVKDLIDRAKAGDLTDRDRELLADLRTNLGALLEAKDDDVDDDDAEPKGLAPEDPRRLELESTLRDLQLRRLATP